MKRLTVLRHAEASPALPGADDFDRPLSAKGWQQARRVGEEIKSRALTFDLVLASTARRVRETLDGVAENLRSVGDSIRGGSLSRDRAVIARPHSGDASGDLVADARRA